MRFPEKIRSSVKGGVSVQLGPRTLLVGRNGSGKSAVVQALELACTGAVTDMEGRESVALAGALARLFPGDDRYVEVVWSDGSRFTWRLSDGAPGSFKEPEETRPFVVRFPILEFYSLFGKQDTTIRSWLEGKAVGDTTVDDIVKAVGPFHEKDVRKLALTVPKVDFLSLAAEAKSQTRTLRTQATSQEKTVDRLTQGLATPLTDGERKAIEDRLAALPSGGGLAPARHAALLTEIAELERELASIPEKSETYQQLQTVTVLEKLITDHVRTFGEKECFVCGSHGDIRKRLDECRTLLQQQSLVSSQMTRAAYIRAALATKKAEAAQPLAPDPAERRNLESVLYADGEARKTWANAQSIRNDVAQKRATANSFAQTATALETYGVSHLNSRKAAFEASVTPFLGEEFGVDLDVARVGMKRGGTLHTALSGVEEARVLLALGASVGAEDAIMIPKDRAWDAETLTATMKTLATSTVPILLMATVLPTEPVEGWTILTEFS